MCGVFPTEVSCNIPNIGAAGEAQSHNGLCVLTQVSFQQLQPKVAFLFPEYNQ